MTTTPIEQLASLRVGMVEFISPDRIEVQLDIESPDSVALNTGTPRNFPRINGYVMIPVDLGFVVGQVSWITIQRSPYPKRSGFQDFGLIDLPFPLRKMELQPVGTLIAAEKGYKFKRGLETFPSVGDIVMKKWNSLMLPHIHTLATNSNITVIRCFKNFIRIFFSICILIFEIKSFK